MRREGRRLEKDPKMRKRERLELAIQLITGSGEREEQIFKMTK